MSFLARLCSARSFPIPAKNRYLHKAQWKGWLKSRQGRSEGQSSHKKSHLVQCLVNYPRGCETELSDTYPGLRRWWRPSTRHVFPERYANNDLKSSCAMNRQVNIRMASSAFERCTAVSLPRPSPHSSYPAPCSLRVSMLVFSIPEQKQVSFNAL